MPPREAFPNAIPYYNYAHAKYYNADVGITHFYVSLPIMHGFIGSPNLTSAYRNPARNAELPGAAPNSHHIYGEALDYNEGSSWANYYQWVTNGGYSPAENILYDQYENKYYNPSWPAPDDIEYRHGHVAWQGH